MLYILAGDPLAAWGRASAIFLAVYLFIFILIGLGVTAGLALGFAWVRQKSELLKKVQPVVNSINTTAEITIKGGQPPAGVHENKIVQTVAEVPAKIDDVDKKIEQGAEKVAQVAIEFRARTVMAQTILKTFFLPALNRKQPERPLEKTGLEFKSPGYRMLMEEKAPEIRPQVGEAYTQAVGAHQLRAMGGEQAEGAAAEKLRAAGLQEKEQPEIPASSPSAGAEQLSTLGEVQAPEKPHPRDTLLR